VRSQLSKGAFVGAKNYSTSQNPPSENEVFFISPNYVPSRGKLITAVY